MSLGTCTALLPVVDETGQRIKYLEDLNRALVESLERIESLFDFVGRNDLTAETDQIFDILFSEARSLVKVQGIALSLVDPSDYQFEVTRVVPQKKKAWAKREIASQIDCGIFSWVLKTGRPSVVPNLSDPEDLVTILVPLHTARRVLGMLMLWSPMQEREVTPQMLKMLSITSRQAALALENSQLYQRVEHEREALRKTGKHLLARQKRIDRELNIARIIQSNLLPRQFPSNAFCRFSARYEPTSAVGGDFYDVTTLEDGSVGIVMADVSGHGVPAAFGTAVLKVLLGGWARKPKDLVETVAQLNQELKGIFEKHQYLTLFLGRIHQNPLKMEYVLAGHPPPLLIRSRTSKIRALSTTGFLVGFDTNVEYRKRSIILQPGDRLLCYTDGLLEIRDPENRAFRFQRLRESIKAHCSEPVEKLPDRILGDVQKFRRGVPIEDDLSVLAIEINQPNEYKRATSHVKKGSR
jgi:serine phosphatase RsbU (regulator of sigma subunit)